MPALVTSSVVVGDAKFEASGSNGPPVGRSGPLPTRDLKPIVMMQGFNGSRAAQKPQKQPRVSMPDPIYHGWKGGGEGRGGRNCSWFW